MVSNNYLLASVASGLERLMVAPQGTLMDQTITAQISAAIYYKTSVLGQLEQNQNFKNRFQTLIFNSIEKDFGEYIDAKARTNSKSLHHVYEWNKTGIKEARLFKLKKVPGEGISFKVSSGFILSKSMVPTGIGRHRHVFANKASVMEAGMPIKIAPRHSERLVFELDGEVVFMPKGASVTVKRPGGAAATNQFYLATSRYFSGSLVNNAIRKSGFQKLFTDSLKRALNVPGDIKVVKYKFSPNIIRSQADMALNLAFGGGA